MKFNKVAAVGLIAAAPFAGQVMALTPAVTPDYTINISGASAQQKTLGALLASFCTTGSLHTYLDGTKGKSWRSYFCTLDATNANVPASLAGKNVLFNNRAKGGSVWGVVPVARDWEVEYMNIFNGNCTVNTSKPTEYNCSVANRARHNTVVLGAGEECHDFLGSAFTAADTQCVKSQGGVSDVEPAMFVAPNLPAGWAELSSTEQAGLTVNSEYAVIFGLHVTNDIYESLQTAQIASGNLPNTCVVGDHATDTCRPSMSKTQVSSILSGDLKNFKQVDPDLVNVGVNGLGFMNVCRRVVGSGTQAAANAYWMENMCRTGPNGGAKSMVEAIDGATYVVTENSSSGSLISCMQDAFDGVTKGYPMGAIGFNAIEKQPTSSKYLNAAGGPGDWDYVKINGIDPTVANAISGEYDYWYEQTIQWLGTLTGAQLDALNMVKNASGDPAVMTAAGLNGVAALPTNVDATGANWDWQNPAHFPTMRGSRGNNSCSPVTLAPAL